MKTFRINHQLESAPLAQQAEHRILNPRVAGSTPARRTLLIL